MEIPLGERAVYMLYKSAPKGEPVLKDIQDCCRTRGTTVILKLRWHRRTRGQDEGVRLDVSMRTLEISHSEESFDKFGLGQRRMKRRRPGVT